MYQTKSRRFLANQFIFGLLLAGPLLSAHASEFVGRGVFLFQSDSGCPLHTLTGESKECNRIALDDADTRASLDTASRTIHLLNSKSYGKKTIVGDVLLQGTGQASDGKRVPLSFHLVLSKSGKKWSTSYHTHAPVRGKFSDVKIDPYQVNIAEQDGERTVLTPSEIITALIDPSFSARFASSLVQVLDNRAKNGQDADITIAVGVKKAAASVMRAQFHTKEVSANNVDAILKKGTWAFELQALTGKIPDRVAQRELFLAGVEGQSLIKPLVERGFKKHEKLIVGALDGKGFIRYGNQQQEFAGAEAAARAFLQQSFIGLILGWHQIDANIGTP